jgi:hypothetical protein
MNISAGIILFIKHYRINKTNLFDEVKSVE